jgi:hypothetical protein
MVERSDSKAVSAASIPRASAVALVHALSDSILVNQFLATYVLVRGLHDDQKAEIVVRQLRTDMIEPHLIERGEVPGWTRFENDTDLSVKVTLKLGYSDLYCEYPDEQANDEGLPSSAKE